MPRLIKVMISSRCSDPIEFEGSDKTFSDVRKKLKEQIENEEIFGAKAFTCWINEDEPAAPGDIDAWELCMKNIKNADIVVALYNGNAGWCRDDLGIGICHAELFTALASGAAKLRIIKLPLIEDLSKSKVDSPNRRFQAYVTDQNRFWGNASKGEEVLTEVNKALHDAVIDMVYLGHLEAARGKYDAGQALDWSRLNYAQRKIAIENVLSASLPGDNPQPDNHSLKIYQVADKQILVKLHGIPAAMGIAAAREMVGRPFLKDYELSNLLTKDINGPIHIIGCHKAVTENQATAILGFPDAIVVSTAFGVYVADNIQKVQLIFLANCRDDSSTRQAVQLFRAWLNSTGEVKYLVDRAASRQKIVNAIAAEIRTIPKKEYLEIKNTIPKTKTLSRKKSKKKAN